MLIPHLVLIIPMILLVLIHDSHGWTTTTTNTAHHRRRRRPTAFVPITDGRSFLPGCCTTTTLCVTTPPNTDKEEEEEEEESILTDVDTRVLRAMLQEEKFINPNDTEELRKLLERGTVKTTPTTSRRNNNNSNNNNDDDEDEASVYSSQVLKTLTDTKLWKKLSVQAGDILESVSIWVSNKVEQDVKVLAALSIFAWDRVQQDVARALPASSSASGILPKPLLLLTNASAYQESTTLSENLRDQMNRPQDELKSVSRELFAILSGERTNYQQQKMQQQQRGLRTVAPAGTVYSGERQRRALQQKRKVEQSKQNVATNIGSNVVDRVWELRQEIKSETNVPGYKTKPLRQAISARTQNLLESVREKAQLVAAATIRQEQPSENELRLSSSSSSSSILSATEEMPVEPTNGNVETAPTTRTDDDDDDDVGAVVVLLLRDIYMERERIMNQLTTAIHRPTESWLTVDVVDTLDSMEVISSPGMQNSLTKMILLRDEIQKNHFDWDETTAMSQNPSASALDAAVNDLLAIRTAIEYLYNTTVQDVSELVAEEMRYFILFGASTSDTNHNSSNNQKNIENDVPLILRIEEEVLRIEKQQQQQENIDEFVAVSVMPTDVDPIRNSVTLPRPSVAVVADAVLVNVEEGEPSTWIANDRKVASTILDDDHDDDDSIASNVAEIVSEDDFDNAVGPTTFKQVYNVNEDEQASDVESSPNLLLVLVLRSLDVLLFVTEQVVTVGAPGTIKVVTNVMTRIDEMNRLGLGTKGWKEFGNAAKAKGRY